MKHRRSRRCFETLEPRCLLAANPIITEMMASNRGSLVDSFGENPDWIEIYNAGDADANLEGWRLTDDLNQLDKWQFPDVTLAAGQYMVVYASGRDLTDPASPLHTNFRLSAGGESLALVKPDGATITSQVGAPYPPQLPDISFGTSSQVISTPLVGPTSARDVYVPRDNRFGSAWTQTEFVTDDSWQKISETNGTAPSAVGYDQSRLAPDNGRYAATVLADQPTGYWRLEELRGGVASNLGTLGETADGTYSDQVQQSVDGVLPGALDRASPFRQSVGQKIDVPYRRELNGTDFSIELWARLDSGSGFRSPVTSRGNSPQEGFMLYASPSDSWEFWTGAGDQTGWNIVRGPAAKLGQWTHLIGTYESATQEQVLYVNGVEVGRRSSTFAPNNADPLRIGGGATEGPGNFFFDGAIDEVAVYDFALTPERIAAHYDQGKPLPTPVVENSLLRADFVNPGPAPLGADAARLVPAGHSPQSPTWTNPDGRLLMGGGGTGSAVFVAPLTKVTFEQPLAVRTEATWESGVAPTADANAYFGLVALHRQGTGSSGADRKGGLFAQAQLRRDGTIDLRFGFQTDSTRDFFDSLVITASETVTTNMDPAASLQLELVIDGLADTDTISFRARQSEAVAEIKTTVGAFRRSLVNGSAVQLAFDSTLNDLRQDPSGMNVGLISTLPLGASADNVDAYSSFEVVTQTLSDESPVANYADQIQTDVSPSMFEQNASAYLRIPFLINDLSEIDRLLLSLRYDDGVVAYLNGTEIARRNAPQSPNWDSSATAVRADIAALTPEVIDVTASLANLQVGTNVLALHGLNWKKDDVDFLLDAQLIAQSITLQADSFSYFRLSSPGQVNTVDGARLGTVVDNVQHVPKVPTESDDIRVTATLVESEVPVDRLTLTYRVMYDDERSLPMMDDGQIPDAVAGDGIYTTLIPRGVAQPGEMVRYFVTSRDVDGQTFRTPFLPNPIETDGRPEYFGTVIQDASVDSPLPVFNWFVPDPRWHLSGGGNNERWSPAAVFYDGQFYDNLQVRVRGLTTINWRKPKLKFEFNDGYEFQFDPEQEPVDEFNLQSHYRETGAVSYMGETLAFEWLREIGVPAPLAFPMHVRQNGDFYSLASFVEQVDQTFLVRNGYDPDGSMYKANSSAVRSTLRPNPTLADYRKVTRKDEPLDDLVRLTDGINNRIENVDRSTFLFDEINLPQVINDMAGNVIMPNHDRLTKNYYMYRDVNGNNEWSRFPWDMDQAFARFTVEHFSSVLYGDSEHPQSPNPIHQNHLYDAILDTPATREMYLRRVRTLVDDYLAIGYFEQKVDQYQELLAVDAARDHAKWRAGDIRNGVRRIKSNVAFRWRQLEAEGLLPASAGSQDLQFGQVEFNPASGNQDEEYIAIVNAGDTSIDLSDWQISGGIDFRFQPGTVIPAKSTLYVSPNVSAFRNRASQPSGGQGLFVQGNYRGHLSNFGETLQLSTADGQLIASRTLPTTPSDVQKFLRVSELNYHPLSNMDAEFIEVVNVSSGADAVTLDLAGVSISQGPSQPYVFAAGTTLPAGQTLMVVNDLAAFTATFPIVDVNQVAGVFEGRLDNGGEQIKIDDADGSTVVQFTYQDQSPWPTAADGQGASLQFFDASATPDDPRAWRAAAPTPGIARMGIDGDLNQDGTVDESDITQLCQALASGDTTFDFTGDGTVDVDDVEAFVLFGLGTQIGDANLDRRFDSNDFIRVFQAGEYEDGIRGNSTWAEGDWNCDGDFNSADLVFALQAGGYVANATPPSRRLAVAAVRSHEHASRGNELRRNVPHTIASRLDQMPPPRQRELAARELIFQQWHEFE